MIVYLVSKGEICRWRVQELMMYGCFYQNTTGVKSGLKADRNVSFLACVSVSMEGVILLILVGKSGVLKFLDRSMYFWRFCSNEQKVR